MAIERSYTQSGCAVVSLDSIYVLRAVNPMSFMAV